MTELSSTQQPPATTIVYAKVWPNFCRTKRKARTPYKGCLHGLKRFDERSHFFSWTNSTNERLILKKAGSFSNFLAQPRTQKIRHTQTMPFQKLIPGHKRSPKGTAITKPFGCESLGPDMTFKKLNWTKFCKQRSRKRHTPWLIPSKELEFHIH